MIADTKPHCKSCARYAGMTTHKRHGTYCVNCRIDMHTTTLRPSRGSRATQSLPCPDYIAKTPNMTMMVIL